MRVAVDEPGNDARAAEVHTFIGSGSVASKTHPFEGVVVDEDSAVLDDAQCAAVPLGRIIGDQFGDARVQAFS